MFLQKFKDHPNFLNLSNELHIDTSVFEAVKNLQCEVEMAGNRLDMTFKQVERTLMIAQLEIPNNQQQLQQQPQQTANQQHHTSITNNKLIHNTYSNQQNPQSLAIPQHHINSIYNMLLKEYQH
uniref:Uncharacterized protein n=1 Tax=Clytia hemisphaerica TaxID=252671 RepID=A0A7M5WR49_9CNID